MRESFIKIAVFAFVAMLAVPAASAQFTGSTLQIEAIKYDPSPAEAGKQLELWLSIDNQGTNNLRDYVVEIVPDFPFYLVAGEDAKREFSILDSNGVVSRFKLRVAEDAPDGDATLKVKHYPKGSVDGSSLDVKISILGKADVEIDSVEPDTLIPGQPTDVTMFVKNSGNAPIRDLVISWSDGKRGVLPIAGENRHRIESLGIGESSKVVFRMIADPGIKQGVHFIDLSMSFLRFGSATNRTSNIAFIVGGLTDFDVAQDDFDGDTMSLSIANIGVNTATGVLLSIPEQDGWEIVGGSDVFLGNLESGDFTVASVDVAPKSLEPQRQRMGVVVQYTDTVGIRQTIEKEIKVNLAGVSGNEDKNDMGILPYAAVAVVVLIVAGFLYMRSRKSKHHQK